MLGLCRTTEMCRALCHIWRLMAVRVSKVPSCDLRPYQLRIICVRCKLWMLWPYSAILGASTPPASPAIHSYYSAITYFFFCFTLFLFHSFSTKVALWQSLATHPGPEALSLASSMSRHNESTWACGQVHDKHGRLMSLARRHYAAASWLLSAWKQSAGIGHRWLDRL